jgi:predicted transcriptional regulator
MIKKTYNDISKEEFYKLYFRLVNVLNPSYNLSNKHIDLLSEFLLLEGDKFKHSRFAAKAKRIVTEVMERKYGVNMSKQNMYNQLKKFENIGLIERDEDGVKYFNKKHQVVLDKIINTGDFVDIVFKIKVI